MRKLLAIILISGLVFGQSGDARATTSINAFYKSWLQLTGTNNDTIVTDVTRIQDGAGYYAPLSIGTDSLVIHGYTVIEKKLTVEDAAGPAILNEAASITNPTLLPNKADPNTGIGGDGSDRLSFIAGGTEVAYAYSSGGVQYFYINSGFGFGATNVVLATYTLDLDDSFIAANHSSGGVQTLSLPASPPSGWIIIIIDIEGNASGNTITIDTVGAETINGAASVTITTDYGWRIISAFGGEYYATGEL